MEAFQQRVVDEKTELDEKLEKLGQFMDGPRFKSVPEEERDRMRVQYGAMKLYSEVLMDRIKYFS